MTSSADFGITDVFAWEALDSRGNPTVACKVTLAGGGRGRCVSPSGASTGSFEARELRDRESRFQGLGVRRAVASVLGVLRPAVLGVDARQLRQVDEIIRGTDTHLDLRRIGSNATLAVSVAVAMAAADGSGLPLWRFLRDGPIVLPMPMIQIFSGGVHAGRMIDIQDVSVIPVGASSFAEAIEMGDRIRRTARRLAASHGALTDLVGDEGGLALPFPTNRQALESAAEAISRAGVEGSAELAVDVAANQLITRDQTYRLAIEGRVLVRDGWIEELANWVDELPIRSMEDPLADDDWSGWKQISSRLGHIQVMGDDLFATDPARLQKGITDAVGNAVLVKPNQRGTLSDAMEVIDMAHAAGYAPVLSARSGESEESWLADLAVGLGTGQIKVGSLTRSDRTAKWNRLLELEADPLVNTSFIGWI